MDLLHDFFPFHSSDSRYVPFGNKLAPEAPTAFLPFSPINFGLSQWLIAQLVERSLSVMKDPGSNLGEDICSFRY